MAILRELVFTGRFRYQGRSRSLAIYRVTDSSLASSVAKQLAQLPWFVKNVVLKVLLSAGLAKVLRRLGRDVPDWPY